MEKLERAKGAFDNLANLKTVIDEHLPNGESSFTFHNGEILSVSLVNTLVEDATESERERLANDIVNRIRTYLVEKNMFPRLSEIVVTYTKHEKKYLIVDFTEHIAQYRYPAEEKDDEG